MTRHTELTAKFLDGTLSVTESVELDSLLATEPGAADDHVALLELEAVLRGLRTEFDLSETTLARVVEAQAKKTTQAVMAGIAAQPAPAWSEKSRPRPESRPEPKRSRWGWFALGGCVAVAAALLVGLWLGTADRPSDRPPARAEDPVVDAQFAKLTHSFGAVELLTPQGEVFTVGEGRDVPPGSTLRTVGEDSLARVEMPDQTTVEIEPDSVVRFDATPTGAGAKSRLFLATGQLTAAVPDRAGAKSLVVGTGVADVFGKKGTFVVSSVGPESARVDIKHGNVDVVRTDAPLPMRVTAGSAFIQSGFTKVVTDPGLRVDRVPARTLTLPGARDIAFVPGDRPGKFDLWVASARQFTLWTHDGGTAETPFLPRRGDGHAVFTRDRTALVTWTPGKDDKVVVRRLPSGDERAFFDLRLLDPRSRAIGPGAEWIAVAEPKPNLKWVRVYDGTTGAERFAREFEDTVGCLAGPADGRTLAIGLLDAGRGVNNKIVLLDAVTNARVTTLPSHRKGLIALAFSDDGKYLAAGYRGMVQVWDVKARELVKSITGFERATACLAFAPDGRTLAAGTPDGQVWVWSVASGRPVQLLEVGSRVVRCVAFSPDGKRLATLGNDSPISIWNVAPIPADTGDEQ